MSVESKASGFEPAETEEKTFGYRLPLEVRANEQSFRFAGFTRQDEKLYLELDYIGAGRDYGLVLRTAIDDAHTYKSVNIPIEQDDGTAQWLNKPTDYDNLLYDPQKVELWHKMLCLKQVSVFAKLVQRLERKYGADNLSGEIIFADENVRKILGLDLEGPFEYVNLKKRDRSKITELA